MVDSAVQAQKAPFIAGSATVEPRQRAALAIPMPPPTSAAFGVAGFVFERGYILGFTARRQREWAKQPGLHPPCLRRGNALTLPRQIGESAPPSS